MKAGSEQSMIYRFQEWNEKYFISRSRFKGITPNPTAVNKTLK